VGNGCPKYNEAVNKAFESDWVKEMEQENKVSDVKFHPLTPTHTHCCLGNAMLSGVLMGDLMLVISIDYYLYLTTQL